MTQESATFTAHKINLLTGYFFIFIFLSFLHFPFSQNKNILTCDGPIYNLHKEFKLTIVMHIALAALKAISLLLF